ncbi:MAG: nickel pincer cofactor biosynthesis protein LarC [Rubripirellula sp.]
MSSLHFDCLSGISGDMTLGALVDLGVDVAEIETAVRSMGLPDVSITARDVTKKGFRATKVDITHPPEHAHRHLHHIEEMIDRGDAIEAAAKDLAKKIFHVVAVAEAKVHGSTLQKVHFHEVGAIDSIADIVGTAVGMTRLGIDSVTASAVPTGTGEITIAHGRVSVPAPATAEILRGVPLAASDIAAELTTPTGAAILKANAGSFGALPCMTIDRIGYGAGTMDLDAQANVLRVYLGDTDVVATASAGLETDKVSVLETNLDDCSPEQIADACERLHQAGALDVYQTPCLMKKGRSGVVLTVMCVPGTEPKFESILFSSTTSIGLRKTIAMRSKLPRQQSVVATKYGDVRVKNVTLPSGDHRYKVEYEDASRLARQHGRSLIEIVNEVQSAVD